MADFRFQNPITILPSFGAVSIPYTERMSETYTNLITNNPIEASAPATDHIIPRLTTISFIGEFSDYPSTNLVGAYTATLGIAKTQFDRLLSLSVSGKDFPVMDGIHFFKAMQFESLNLIKETDDFTIRFEATLKQVRKIAADVVTQGTEALGENVLRAAFMVPSILITGSIATGAVSTLGILA